MMVLWGTTPYDGYMGSPLYDEITTLSRHTRRPRGRGRRSLRGPWQGTVRCRTSENAVVYTQPVRECSGLRVQEEGGAFAESQVASESQVPNVKVKSESLSAKTVSLNLEDRPWKSCLV